jgi:hypothetical protein
VLSFPVFRDQHSRQPVQASSLRNLSALCVGGYPERSRRALDFSPLGLTFDLQLSTLNLRLLQIRSLSFQLLTNCTRFAAHSEPVSFQSVTNCPFYNPFVFIFIHVMGGVPPRISPVVRALQRFLDLFPFFSHSCALFCTAGATQLFWNQFVAHSFRRHGGIPGTHFSYAGGSTGQGGTLFFPTHPFQPSTFNSQLSYD